MAALPSSVSYGKVVGRFLLAVGDTADADLVPDGVPAQGFVTFNAAPDYVLNNNSGTFTTVYLDTIVCPLDVNGYITDPAGQQGVWLVATDDPDNNPSGWTYTVTVTITNSATLPKTFSINVPAGTTQDITTITPVDDNTGTPVTVGPVGPTGPANVLSVGTVTTLAPTAAPTVTITGTSPSQTINFGIPAGAKWTSGAGAPATGSGAVGDWYINTTTWDAYEKTAAATWTVRVNLRGATGATGPAPNLAIGTVTNATAGAAPTATITGTNPNYSLNLNFPLANWAIGTTTTLAPTATPTAAIGGTALNPTLSLGLPAGAKWLTGTVDPVAGTGLQGDWFLNTSDWDIFEKTSSTVWTARGNIRGATGPAPNLAIGTVAAQTAGAAPTATITGTNPNYSLNLNLPLPNFTVPTVNTLAAGASATVTLGGTALNPTLTFGIPQGLSGGRWLSGSGAPAAGTGQQGDWYVDTASANYTYYEKTTSTVWTSRGTLKGPPGSMGGPASSVDGNLASFSGTSGTLLQDSGVAASNLMLLTGNQDISGNKAFTGTLRAGANNAALTGTLPNGTGTNVAPNITAYGSTFAGVAAFTNDGTRNRRAGLFVNDTDALWGLSATNSSGISIPFVINSVGTEWLRIDTVGSLGVGTSSPLATTHISATSSGRRVFQVTGRSNTVNVTNKALTANVATLTTAAAHQFSVGREVVVSGVDATFNGTFTIASVPTTTTFTYAKTAADVASVAATGTAQGDLQTADLVRIERGTQAVALALNNLGSFSVFPEVLTPVVSRPINYAGNQSLAGFTVTTKSISGGDGNPVYMWESAFGLASDSGGSPRVGIKNILRNFADGTVSTNIEPLSIALTSGNVGFGTTAPTHTITLPSTSTSGYAHYNTVDQLVNYERGRQYWASNRFWITTEKGGTGTLRDIAIGPDGTNSNYVYIISPSGTSAHLLTTPAASSFSNVARVTSVGLTSASTVQNGLLVDPIVNQSGTASYAALKVNVTETATGSGSKRLLDLGVGGTTLAYVDNAGVLSLAAGTARVQVNQAAAVTTGVYHAAVAGDTATRYAVQADGKIAWGPGNASADTNLYRGGVGLLKTDNSLTVSSNLTVNGVFNNTVSGAFASGSSLYHISDLTGSGNADGTSAPRQHTYSVTGTGANNIAALQGASYDIYNSMSAGTIGVATGLSLGLRSTNAGATTAAYAYRAIPILTGTGGIASYYAFESRTPSVSSTGGITTAYGIFLNAMKVAGVTTAYGVYQNGASDPNYFAGSVGIGTNAPTHSLTLASASTGSAHYNTADQTTNFERVRGVWISNTWGLLSEAGGTGVVRDIVFKSGGNPAFTLSNSGATKFTLTGGTVSGSGNVVAWLTGTFSAASGLQTGLLIEPTITQTGTASYTALRVNVAAETTTGSGAKTLLDLAVASNSKFNVANNGALGQNNFAATTDLAQGTALTGDAQNRYVLRADGKMEWGPGGSTARDTNLYRSAVDTLKTDDNFIVAKGFTVGSTDTDLTMDQTVHVDTHTRSTTYTYNTDGTIATAVEKAGATTVRSTTYNYTAGVLTSEVEVAGGKTITTTYGYTSGNLTSETRTVA